MTPKTTQTPGVIYFDGSFSHGSYSFQASVPILVEGVARTMMLVSRVFGARSTYKDIHLSRYLKLLIASLFPLHLL